MSTCWPLNNSPVNFDDFFEDLEAQFEAQISSTATVQQQRTDAPEGPVLLEIWCRDDNRINLIAPSLGQDFVAGVDLVSNSLNVISYRWIKSIKVHQVATGVSFELKRSGLELAEFCQVFSESKLLVKLVFLDPAIATIQGHISGQLMSLVGFTPSGSTSIQYIPAISIAKFEHLPVNN